MEKIEIDKNKPLVPGDVIEMHFKTAGMGILTAAQIAIIEWQIEKRKDFRITSHSLPAGNRVFFTIRVTQPPADQVPKVYEAGIGVTITAAIIGAAIIGAGVVAWLTLDKVYQIMESPAGKAAVVGMSLFIPALAVLAISIFSIALNSKQYYNIPGYIFGRYAD